MTVADPDSASLVSATVAVSSNYVVGEDVLSFTNTANISGSWNALSGSLTLTGSDTVAGYEAALRTVRYANASESPSALPRTVGFTVSDGALTSNTANRTITVTPVNDPPSASNLNAGETFTEDTALNLVDIVAADVDDASVTATLTVSNVAAGSLNTATSGAVTSTYVPATGVWTAAGAIANVNVLLAGLTFTPAVNFNGSFTIATSVSDGAASVSGSKAISGVAVNDPPSASNLNVGETFTEDTALNLVDIVAADVDDASVTATLTVSNVAAGSLNTATSGAVTSTYVPATGVWTAAGAIANVNVLLAGLTFTPAVDFNGSFTIATSVSDGAASVSGSKAISGVAVNDAPSLGNGVLAAVVEDTVSPAGELLGTVFAGQFADVDAGSSFAGIAVVGNTASAATQGVWQYSSNAGGNWFAVGAVADGAGGAGCWAVETLVRFVPVADYNGSPPALVVRGLDNTYGGGFSTTAGSETRVTVNTTGNGGSTPIAAVTATLSTTVTAAGDAPVVVATGSALVYRGERGGDGGRPGCVGGRSRQREPGLGDRHGLVELCGWRGCVVVHEHGEHLRQLERAQWQPDLDGLGHGRGLRGGVADGALREREREPERAAANGRLHRLRRRPDQQHREPHDHRHPRQRPAVGVGWVGFGGGGRCFVVG